MASFARLVTALSLALTMARVLLLAARRVRLRYCLRAGGCPALARYGPVRATALCQRPDAPPRGLCPAELTALIFATLEPAEARRPRLDTLPDDARCRLR